MTSTIFIKKLNRWILQGLQFSWGGSVTDWAAPSSCDVHCIKMMAIPVGSDKKVERFHMSVIVSRVLQIVLALHSRVPYTQNVDGHTRLSHIFLFHFAQK